MLVYLETRVHPSHICCVLTCVASAGSKLCVLGANFVRSDRLRVRIGEHIVVPQFHESGTLVCVVPPCHTQYVTVAVSNNNKAWSEQVLSLIHI